MNSLKKIMLITVAGSGLSVSAEEINSERQKLSYSIGVVFAQGIKNQNIDVDTRAFTRAVADVLNDSRLKLSNAEIQKQLTNYQKQQQGQRLADAKYNLSAGEKYLAANKKKDGVTTLPSGLQYQVLKTGSGPKPTAESTVVVHYRGNLIDGTEFDSSYSKNRPIDFSLTRVIKGWQEALQLMPVGSKWKITVPSELAYGEMGAGGKIGPHATLIFDIELLEIK